jgi:hypothetical protein
VAYRWRRVAVGLALALVGTLALTGCSAVLTTGPTYTVEGLFLYLRTGAGESAWQEIGPALQVSNRPVPARAPDGRAAIALRWTSDRAFRRQAPDQLAPFLRHARIQGQVQGSLAYVVVRAAPPSSAVAYMTLARVDNEWVIQRLVVAGTAH